MVQRIRRFPRYLKFQYVKLLRAKGGAYSIAMGFAIGLFVEMFNLPTYGTSFVLIFPLIFLLRGSLAAALIGFVFGKLIYIPMSIPNKIVGGAVLPKNFTIEIPFLPENINHFLLFNLKMIVGGMIDGLALGLLFFFPIWYSVETFKRKRREKRRIRKELKAETALE
ncbi:DUF2062 domain-containing protein [Cohnella sp. REN36]|uniref:DUF2062 domain-containing protein n=1 Tax=Cohnella sp. REN36 TaxID=2887347 RepID=UPI001D140F78|nr:DUF2062 domain-containing protein [Cohnella sp. REN36]MCC3377070.1 DUF2062 domain-containing protein [Cohnella sp. REN36]